MSLIQLTTEIDRLKNPTKAKDLQWFFKTGPGQYGEGDQFLGIVVPLQRQLVKLYWDTVNLHDIQVLLNSQYHEYRLIGLLILVNQYSQNPDDIFNFYLQSTSRINNWDLVDLSCHKIVGRYCYDHHNYSVLIKLAHSSNLWERRIAIVATAYFIGKLDFTPTIAVAKILLTDSHDLIHKAVGWMLREVGKRHQKVLTDFLDEFTLLMPRTALRYAIEKLPETQRQYYLKLRRTTS